MNVIALRHAPVLPKPGSSVIIPRPLRNCAMSIPSSASVPSTSGRVRLRPSASSRTVRAAGVVGSVMRRPPQIGGRSVPQFCRAGRDVRRTAALAKSFLADAVQRARARVPGEILPEAQVFSITTGGPQQWHAAAAGGETTATLRFSRLSGMPRRSRSQRSAPPAARHHQGSRRGSLRCWGRRRSESSGSGTPRRGGP